MHALMISYHTKKKFEEFKRCLKCGLSRYKVKDSEQDDSDACGKEGPSIVSIMHVERRVLLLCPFDIFQ